MKSKLPTPKNLYVLIEVAKTKKETDSGIVLPESKQNKEQTVGIVRAVSQNCINTIQEVVNVGMRVVFNPFDALSYTENGSNYIFIQHKDIIAILNN